MESPSISGGFNEHCILMYMFYVYKEINEYINTVLEVIVCGQPFGCTNQAKGTA